MASARPPSERLAEEARLVHDADDAAGVGDGAQLLVVDVAPVAVDAGDAGVADEERLRAIVRGDGVEEAAPVDVRQVDEDAVAVERAHELAAAIGERAVAAAERSDGALVVPRLDVDRCTSVTLMSRLASKLSSARSPSSALPPWMPMKAACWPAARAAR